MTFIQFSIIVVEFVLELDHGGDLIGVDVEKESGGDKDQERTEELAGYQSSVDKQRGNIDAEEENGGEDEDIVLPHQDERTVKVK